MRYARIMGAAFLALCLAAPLAAQATLPPDVTQRLQIAAYESRAFDQRDIAMAQQLNSGELLSSVARRSGRHASAAMSAAVIGSISENPALAGEIVATAVAVAPELRDSIVSDAIKAFPQFAPTIAAAAATAPADYGQTPTYYAQLPAEAPVSGQTAPGASAVGEANAYSIHDYTARFRPLVWAVFVEGDYETITSQGRNVSVAFYDDLGYDDTYPTFNGELSFRGGRHDFWITGYVFDESSSKPINLEFTIRNRVFNVGAVVDTEVKLTDINFRYGYSFFEFEEDGFRFGPTLAISYSDLSVTLTEVTIQGAATGTRFTYEETLPIPTLGIHAEIPIGRFMLSTQLGGFYIDTGDFEATGIRAEAGVTWRPYDHVGFFAGILATFADLDLDDEQINDVLLWGPAVGMEFRF